MAVATALRALRDRVQRSRAGRLTWRIGVTVLGETILPIQLVGMVVIFFGLLFIDGRIRHVWKGARA